MYKVVLQMSVCYKQHGYVNPPEVQASQVVTKNTHCSVSTVLCCENVVVCRYECWSPVDPGQLQQDNLLAGSPQVSCPTASSANQQQNAKQVVQLQAGKPRSILAAAFTMSNVLSILSNVFVCAKLDSHICGSSRTVQVPLKNGMSLQWC